MTKFPHKTNQWIEEEVEIPTMTPVINEGMKRVEFKQTTQKATRKTFYSDSPTKKVVCAGGEHKFRCVDKGKYIFKCRHCDFHKVAFPVTYRYNQQTGKLTHRITENQV